MADWVDFRKKPETISIESLETKMGDLGLFLLMKDVSKEYQKGYFQALADVVGILEE